MKQGDGNPGVVKSTLEGDIKRVGSYVIVSELGQGSFGKVYKARHVGTDELFALKVIPVGKVSSSYLKKLMNSEVRIMQQVKHPNVVHLHEFMTSGTHYYMVLDYCEGGDLFKYVRTRPKKYVEESDSVEIFKQIMNGFLELRRNRVIHRDIKSENIFRKDRQWLIGDFGLAKMGEDTATSYVGSYEFMAPEMLRSGPRSKVNYSSKVDLWSIGCLFFEILFGDTPFHYKSTPQLLDDVKKRGGKNLVFPRTVSPKMQDLLRGLLEDDPENRLGWEAFFAHPVFETGKVLDPKDAPQINGITEMVENQNRVEKEFAENRKADFKELEKPEINLLEVAKPENKAVSTRPRFNTSMNGTSCGGSATSPRSSKPSHETPSSEPSRKTWSSGQRWFRGKP